MLLLIYSLPMSWIFFRCLKSLGLNPLRRQRLLWYHQLKHVGARRHDPRRSAAHPPPLDPPALDGRLIHPRRRRLLVWLSRNRPLRVGELLERRRGGRQRHRQGGFPVLAFARAGLI